MKFRLFKRKVSDEDKIIEQEIENIDNTKKMEKAEAMDFLQRSLISSDYFSQEELQTLQSYAMSADKESKKALVNYFISAIEENNIVVDNCNTETLAKDTFSEKYGLWILEKYKEDPTVDEIRVNRTDNIRIVRKGVSYKIPEKYNDENEIERAIKRLIMEDVGISLDKSNPTIESILKDGSRLTAVCPPVSESWSFIIRKHDSFEATLENYIEFGTFDKFVWDRLSVLARGNSKMLFSGNVSSGKSTLLKKVVGELSENFRIGVLGKDSEIKLQEKYPDRDIIEFEEQPHLGVKMKQLFETMLRESIDVLVVEEFRGSGEAIEAVRACSRGLPSAFSTAHFNNPEEAVEGIGLLLIEEGLNLTLDLAKLRAARAFNIVVQLFGDSITGRKKLLNVSEIITTPEGNIVINDIIKWKPSSDDFFGDGVWEQINQPSKAMLRSILVNVARKEVEALGWETYGIL